MTNPVRTVMLGDELCLSWRISNHCDLTPGPKLAEADCSRRNSLDTHTQSSHHSRIMRIRVLDLRFSH